MINWWREGLYLDWLEITFIAVLVGLSLVCVVYGCSRREVFRTTCGELFYDKENV